MSIYQGERLKIEISGASHAEEISVAMEGFPAGVQVDMAVLQAFLTRRAPGKHPWETARKEADIPEFISGLSDGMTTGKTLRALIRNTNRHSRDYEQLKTVPRPGHADYTAFVRYSGKLDMRGGGPFSGRMTAPLCIAGGICLQYLASKGIRVMSRIKSIGPIRDDTLFSESVSEKTFPVTDDACGEQMRELILQCRQAGDSVGGVVESLVTGFPAGIGGPMFEGLEGRIAAVMFAVPAVKGIEFGDGFHASEMKGSEHNDAFRIENGKVVTKTNHCGGILGGISDGMPLTFRTAFKPTPSIALPQESVDLETMKETELTIHGRHDPCIVPRAVPVTEAATALALTDALLSTEQKHGEE